MIVCFFVISLSPILLSFNFYDFVYYTKKGVEYIAYNDNHSYFTLNPDEKVLTNCFMSSSLEYNIKNR
ncbi:hypothetical protein VL4N_15920 [Vagococcus lutrae]|nr:hypothetical protein VL2N_15570 [Vagococcus lutrae]GEQ64151.1 hypothetical protein VL3N_15930 [Vagococcus lutrae]GEQ66042.1 hypothetical protein VL4N_15920 [Vagococcus lutrae]